MMTSGSAVRAISSAKKPLNCGKMQLNGMAFGRLISMMLSQRSASTYMGG